MRWWWLFAAWVVVGAAHAADVATADAKEVRGVIQAQLDALAADDAARAFALAAPGIRDLFGDADRFVAMVRSTYPAVYRPTAVTFLPPQRDGADLTQPVRLTDGNGGLWLALYHMQRQPDKSWRISGCELAELQGQAV
jgi:hypothetical protein